MTPAATVALVAAGVAAAVDWWAVATGRRAVEVVAKPAATAALTPDRAGRTTSRW